MTRNYCVYTDHDFVAPLIALHESMIKWCKPFKLWVLALTSQAERMLPKLDLEFTKICQLANTIETWKTKELRSQRARKQFIWTLKPLWVAWVLRQGIPNITYLDCDSYFFAPPIEVYKEIGNAAIAIAPHRFSRRFLNRAPEAGVFNAGFIYFRRCEIAAKCASRWSEQVINRCERNPQEGYFDDQKYLDEWPELWGAHVVLHKGWDLAPWNQGDGHYAYTFEDKQFFVDGEKLIWYHFHQGMNAKGYKIDPMLRLHVYSQYAGALGRAKRRIKKC